jgi:hypothetical protein
MVILEPFPLDSVDVPDWVPWSLARGLDDNISWRTSVNVMPRRANIVVIVLPLRVSTLTFTRGHPNGSVTNVPLIITIVHLLGLAPAG